METREESIERIMKKLRRAGESRRTFAFDIELRDSRGSVVDSFKGTSRDFKTDDDNGVERAVEVMEKKIRESLEDYPNVFSIAGSAGEIRKGNRTIINDIIPVEIEEDEMPMPTPLVQQQVNPIQKKEADKPQETEEHQRQMSMDSLNDIFETLNVMGDAFGVHGLGNINSLENKKMAFVIQMRDNQLKAQQREREQLGTIKSQETKITELSTEISLLKKNMEKLKSENEKMKNRLDKQKPKMAEYEKLKTKNGRIAAIAGDALGHIMAGALSHTKYGALLGITEEIQTPQEEDDDDEMMQQQQEEPQAQVVRVEDGEE